MSVKQTGSSSLSSWNLTQWGYAARGLLIQNFNHLAIYIVTSGILRWQMIVFRFLLDSLHSFGGSRFDCLPFFCWSCCFEVVVLKLLLLFWSCWCFEVVVVLKLLYFVWWESASVKTGHKIHWSQSNYYKRRTVWRTVPAVTTRGRFGEYEGLSLQ